MKKTDRGAEKSRVGSKRALKTMKSSVDTRDNLAPDDYRQVIHDLQVHQIELARQNEELRDIQLKLEESRARYLDLYDHAPVGYFTFDDKGEILAVNLTGCRKLGRERESLHKSFLTSFMSREDSDLFYLHLKKVFASTTQQTCNLTLFQKDGGSFYAQLDSVAAAGDAGEQPKCQTTITNISQQKELEDALQFTETRYKRLFETALEGVMILDAETGEISDANPSIIEMLGYTYAEFLGKKPWKIGCFTDVQAAKEAFQTLHSKGFVRSDNLQMETRNGRKIAVEFIGSVYLVNDQKIIQCSIRDVSERLLLQEVPPKVDHDGSERRMAERRAQARQMSEQTAKKNKEHQQSAEALRKALEEIKTLKDRLVVENIFFRQEIKKKHQFDHIIGQSDGLKYVLYRAEQVAPTDTTVLILGETGTGKELIAEAIHGLSPRKDRPLMTVNCAALPANLLESELFGREKGAFTGAETRQIGRFEVADGSTLCLDEIGELPLEMQAKLLRVIQHGEFERLGSSKTLKVDVRLVATTNRNLEEEVRKGLFRQDLYYRLNVFPITVPPLRQRQEDIPMMVQAFVERYARKMGKQMTSISKDTMQTLQDYPWPGNVRELESIIERAVILCPGTGFQLTDTLNPVPAEAFEGGTAKEMERNYIMKTLTQTDWRIEGKSGAAKILGLHPSTLRARMHKLEIIRPGRDKAE